MYIPTCPLSLIKCIALDRCQHWFAGLWSYHSTCWTQINNLLYEISGDPVVHVDNLEATNKQLQTCLPSLIIIAYLYTGIREEDEKCKILTGLD